MKFCSGSAMASGVKSIGLDHDLSRFDCGIDLLYQHQGLGKALLFDAVMRTLQAGEIAGVTALLVHALSDEARRFYLSCGFRPSPIQAMTLCLRLADVNAAMAG